MTITLFALVMSLRGAMAQDNTAWVQVEALPTLLEAEERVRDYSEIFGNVSGFTIDSGWYAIVLGPFPEDEARVQLGLMRRNGQVPRDSFVTRSDAFGQQFWPVGASARTDTAAEAGQEQVAQAETQPAPEPEPEPTPEPEPEPEPQETVQEARRSEAQLDTQQKKDLQIALQWAGFYDAAIDAAFGGGTRRSMREWQEANGHEPTGVLTTRQRAQLLAQYNAVLEGMGLEVVRDEVTGIEMKLPLGVVEFDAHEAPFARYDATTDLGARVLLISQRGDQRRLFGLYDILQTLEVVPLDGPRERRNDGFTITGRNSEIVSHTEVSLRGGEIKGFMLIWPLGDEDRRARVLQEMSQSFTRIDGVMPASTGLDQGQSVDLVAGLRIRKPKLSRTGFFVSPQGAVLTTTEAVAGCSRVTLDGHTEAQVSATDDQLGVAVLTPETSLAPMEVAELASYSPRLQSEVAVAGFSYEGILGAPSMTFGTLVDLQGLNGEERLDRHAITTLPGDAGGPVMDGAGAVIGLLLPKGGEGRQLPDEVSFSADAAALQSTLRQAGVSARVARGGGASMAAEDLTRKARGMTVLVSCWE